MIRTELSLRIQNSPGAVARVCETLSSERVNFLAIAVETSGLMRVVVDNPVHAAGALREHHYHVEEREVLVIQVANDPGAFTKIARLMAETGVNLEYVYGTAIEDAAMATLVVGVADAQRASAAAGV